MKELSIEQKATAYDKAIEKVRSLHNDYDTVSTLIDIKAALEHIFPELKESEDEKIRKWLIGYLENKILNSVIIDERKNCQDAIAWLEKQGKHANFRNKIQIGDKVTRNDNGELVNLSQLERVAKKLEKQEEQKPVEEYNITGIGSKNAQGKLGEMIKNLKPVNEVLEQMPADKVEPKFHEGEWLCENEPNNYARFIQILETVNVQGKERYRISRDIHNDEDIVEFDFVEKYYHKFDIKDAKDGDVLVHNSFMFDDFIFIYNSTSVLQVCCYYSKKKNRFIIDDRGHHYPWNMQEVTPATKEQREQLEKAMADAGYTFDFEKKELKEIEQNPIEWHREDKQNLNVCLGYIPDESLRRWLTDIIHVRYDKPAWSEEDENMCLDLIQYFTDEYGLEHNLAYIVDWLKSLKERVQPQPKQWDKEDEAHFDSISKRCTPGIIYTSTKYSISEDINWLKSLKDRYTWKPSDEQMERLKGIINSLPHQEVLYSLYQDLKKLKEGE